MFSVNSKDSERENYSRLMIVLTSSLTATVISLMFNLGVEMLYRVPKEKAEKKAEKKRVVAEEVLNNVLPLQKHFEALLMQPSFSATDAEVRDQAKFLLRLSDEVNDKCLTKPFVETLQITQRLA